MDEPEVKLGENILVPDPAGWKKEGLPDLPEQENRISVSPDWVCEVLSPATVRTDRVLKMPVNAKFGVASAWLIDPTFKTLEAFRPGRKRIPSRDRPLHALVRPCRS